MSDFWENGVAGFFLGISLGSLSLFILGLSLGSSTEESRWHKATIERGLAQYCPHDGEWAWKGECDE
jgi:hypothetical protein